MYLKEDTWQKRLMESGEQTPPQSADVIDNTRGLTNASIEDTLSTKDAVVRQLLLAASNLKSAGRPVKPESVLQTTELALAKEISHFWSSIFHKIAARLMRLILGCPMTLVSLRM